MSAPFVVINGVTGEFSPRLYWDEFEADDAAFTAGMDWTAWHFNILAGETWAQSLVANLRNALKEAANA